ncbi:hypothetical protein ELE36_07630 [Pseudolysobacter antarcticus]|uniref:Glycosyltransferase subfamily 4-like N-terminal domain-containing protein n=1 Tax=Pseudolysobacter antarcticus TaxID=2511995 RepID=A0A411HIB6_9GAMM|nr:glycosyltransferase [Pseudolysobacter antarcticus]QBB70243.1 hypothetical protein ELE36_07630 [Pseudolysobacter antarcticus]
MRVLITNNTLATPAGTEMYVRDVALGLLRRGHQPIAYSTQLGTVARMLHDATIPVIDDLNKLAVVPDVIHGQHHLDAMTAMLHFPQTPSVYFCHGWVTWEEMPAIFPTLQHYVAVDDLCVERLQCEHGIVPDRIHTIRNFVDLHRFGMREPLPTKPQRALVFSNRAHEQGYLGIIRQACSERRISVDVMGAAAHRSAESPEQFLGSYDIIFAKARSAIEAMACGVAVITCDSFGLGGMVTQQNYAQSRALNFGMRTLHRSISVQHVLDELDRYDAQDAQAITLRIRKEADMEPAIDAIVEVYTRAIASHAAAPAALQPHMTAASDYLRKIAVEAKLRGEAEKLRIVAQAEAATQCLRAEFAEQQNMPIKACAKPVCDTELGTKIASAAKFETIPAPRRSPNELHAWQREQLAVHVAAIEQQGILGLYDKLRSAEHPANTKTPFWRLFVRAYSTRNSYVDCFSARLKLLRARHRPDPFIENLYDEILAKHERVSGMQTTPATSLQSELSTMFAQLGIHALVEIACGHCIWLTSPEPGLQYTGIDLSRALIEQNRRRFASFSWTFALIDVVTSSIPLADAVLCRDWLHFLPLSSISGALHHMRVSGAKYLIATTAPAITTNSETQTGTWRALNLMRPPFNLHEPVMHIEYNGKMLGIWQLRDA